MTEICRTIIDHPSAWTPEGVGGKAGLERPLEPAHLAAIDELLARTAHKPALEVTKAEWSHPALAALFAELDRTIKAGRGLVIVTGLAPGRYDAEQFKRIYWGFGTHLGVAVEQSQWGDRLGYVQKEENDPTARGYRSQEEIGLHTDSFELAGLMCVQRAESGGVSSMASTMTVHNHLLRERPDLLPPLYAGFHYAIPELQHSSRPITAERIPVFTYVDGTLSCLYSGGFMQAAARKLGVPLPDGLEEALAYFRAVSLRPEVSLSFMLEPGEMMLWHNWTNLHARTAFENSARHTRLLLRLWMEVPGGRPTTRELRARGDAYRWVYEERRRQMQPA